MYEKMYRELMRAVADAMDMIEAREYQQALFVLEKASKGSEEIYISEG